MTTKSSRFAPVDEQMELLRRGAVDLVTEDQLRGKLERSRESGEPLTVKVGFDPTAPDMPMPGDEFRPDEASEPGQPPNVEQEEREPRKKKKEKTMKSLVARHIGRSW